VPLKDVVFALFLVLFGSSEFLKVGFSKLEGPTNGSIFIEVYKIWTSNFKKFISYSYSAKIRFCLIKDTLLFTT
jgi:hypothetical protein